MLEEFISKIQYLIGDYGYNFLCSNNQRYSNATFQRLLELEFVLEYFTSSDIVNKDPQYLAQLIDFFETRYNFNNIPYIEYPNRVTNILIGYGTGHSDIIFGGVEEAPYDGKLYARKNKQWWEINFYTQEQSDELYYPLNENPAGYLTEDDKHDPVTLGTTNGLSLDGQELSLDLVTTSTAGAMSASDKTKLDGLSNYIHPTGFTNAPTTALSGNTVISRILVNDNGHVTGVDTRELNLGAIGVTAAPLTRTNDTNVTLTLGGTPATSLLQAVSLTLGWTGQLSVLRGGTGAATFNSGEVLIGNGTSPITTLSRFGIDTRTVFPPSSHNLTSHSDVNIVEPEEGQVLGYNGTIWTNLTLDLDDFDFEETDPVFVAFRDASRTANTVYAAPNSSSGAATFRNLVAADIPNIYLRFDTIQSLTELQKQNVITALGIQSSTGTYEPAFLKGDIYSQTSEVITITNGANRVIGDSDLLIDHAESGWNPKTGLETNQVISNLMVDDYGHIADWDIRNLTLDDITEPGYKDSLDNIIDLVQDLEEALYEVNLIKIKRPVHKHYESTQDMIDGQGCNCQLQGFLYFDGSVYWEYLGTTNGDISDYNPIGGGIAPILDELEGSFVYVSGDQEFELLGEPADNRHVLVTVNGQKIPQSSYSIVGTTLIILEELEENYLVEIQYKI